MFRLGPGLSIQVRKVQKINWQRLSICTIEAKKCDQKRKKIVARANWVTLLAVREIWLEPFVSTQVQPFFASLFSLGPSIPSYFLSLSLSPPLFLIASYDKVKSGKKWKNGKKGIFKVLSFLFYPQRYNISVQEFYLPSSKKITLIFIKIF